MVPICVVDHDVTHHRLDWQSCHVPIPTGRDSASDGRSAACDCWDSLLCPAADRRVAREKDEATACCLDRPRWSDRDLDDTRLHLRSDAIGANHTVRQFDSDTRDTVPASIDRCPRAT